MNCAAGATVFLATGNQTLFWMVRYIHCED
jgi:hypothetical protein